MNNIFSKNRIVFPALVLPVIIFLVSCNSLFPGTETKTANDYIYDCFEDWYLWYDQIPDIDPDGIDSQEALIDSIKSPLDRWSFSTSLTKLQALLKGGQYTGFGAGFILDTDNQIKITQVYKNSPLGRPGVERGWIVVSINGYTSDDLENVNNELSNSETITFEFYDLNKNPKTITATREEISMNTVLYSNVYDYGQTKIGYFVFDSFVETSADELDSIFTDFKNKGVNELIVDLRYNGGGLNDIAYQLIGMIGGNKVKNQIIANLKNNDKHTEKNSSVKSDYDGVSLSINRVYFITTSQTASASELVINCLSPFVEVNLVGSQTHGKPVGMYIFQIKKLDLAILPICFKTTNELGYGDYFNGLPVSINANDDFSHNWGDTNETMLNTALNAIVPAVSIQPLAKSSLARLPKPFNYKGINRIINAY